jgi:hypothetical protein
MPKPTTTPTCYYTHLPAVDVESQKCDPVSQRHRQLALSTSDDVAGTWNHFSASFTLELYLCTLPLHATNNPIKPGAHKMPKHTEGQGPPLGSCHLELPIAGGQTGSDRGIPHASSTMKRRGKNMKTTAASSDSASVLPDDAAGDGVHICTKYHPRPPPGSPFRLPVMFQSNLERGSGRFTSSARTFCARSLRNYIVCIVA